MKDKKPRLLVAKTSETAVVPSYSKEDGTSSFDLFADDDVVIAPFQSVAVEIGVSFAIPSNYELHITPCEDITASTKLRVNTRILSFWNTEPVAIQVDNINCYRHGSPPVDLDGEPLTKFDGIDGGAVLIRKGDRIAQGTLRESLDYSLEEMGGD